jgi:AcrR family transcriptional regulator
MPTRSYDNSTRRRRQGELKEQIAAATAELHASQGVFATSYAQIAQRAGVSLPTVYKHFSSLDELLQACTGHVSAQAPAFPQERVLEAPDLSAAAGVLVEACDALNAHFEPWFAWRENRQLLVLQQQGEQRRGRMLALFTMLLHRHGASGSHAQIAAVWESLLHFDFWHRLKRDHKLSRAAIRACQLHQMLAALGPQPGMHSSQRPRSSKSPS